MGKVHSGWATRLGHALQAGQLRAVGEQQQHGGLHARRLVAQAPGVRAGCQALQVQRVQGALQRRAQPRDVAGCRALQRRQETRPWVPAGSQSGRLEHGGVEGTFGSAREVHAPVEGLHGGAALLAGHERIHVPAICRVALPHLP